MSDSTDPSVTPETPQRTTGGNFRWEPPSPAELEAQMPGYSIERLLGRGGMGAVYRGVQTNLDRTVAIKILPPGVEQEDPSFAERFRNEAKLMAKLNHPAVVAVHDFGTTTGGLLYFAMEYVDGTDVSQMIRAQKQLPPEHALAITAHVCDALAAAHELGIVHRDIKPANVLINMKGQVKVADFGLAKVEEPGSHGLTKTGYAMGTPDFVAPEVLMLGANIDGRADLYAVGVMLYQMLTGEVPRGAFKPATARLPGLDPRFDPIILKAMQSDREERYQSSAELRRDLDVILTVPLVRQDDTPSAAIPAAQVAQQPAQRSAAQKPEGSVGTHARHPGPGGSAATMNEAERSLRAPVSPKSKVPLLLGLTAVVAVGVGAFVMFGGRKQAPSPETAMPQVPPQTQVAKAPSVSKTQPAAPLKPKPAVVEAASTATKPVPTTSAPAPMPSEAKQAVPATSAAPTPTVAKPSTPVPVETVRPAAPTAPPVVPPWLVEARKLGGRTRFFGSGPDGATETGQAAEFGDFIEVVLNGNGFAARRMGGETHGVVWMSKSSKYLNGGMAVGPFSISQISRGNSITMRDSRDGSYRNIWRGTSQNQPAVAHPESRTVAHVHNYMLVLDAHGRILKEHKWDKGRVTPPDDFFFNAAAITATFDNFLAAKPGRPIQSWNVPSGKLTEFSADLGNIQEMDASERHVVLLNEDGQVFVTDPEGKLVTNAYGKIPADLGPAIAVRAGRGMCAAQMTDGTWVAWGESPELVEHTKKIGPALDVDYDFDQAVNSNCMLWIDAASTAPLATNAPTGQTPAPAANDLYARLGQIASQFQTAYDRDIAPGHAAAVADLDGKYLAAVNRALGTATKKGALEEAVKLREEVQRLTEKQPLPPVDLDTLPASLMALRSTYRSALAKLEQDRDVKAKPYYDRYDELLDGYQRELTQQKRLDDALKIKARRDELAKSRESPAPATALAANPPAAPAPSAPTARKPTSTSAVTLQGSPWRTAAEWVLSLRGRLNIDKDGQRISVRKLEDLPPGKFDILVVEFQTSFQHDGIKMTDADLTRLNPIAKTLERLLLENCNITGSGFEAIAGAVKLQQLSLDKSPVTDEALKHLVGLGELTNLGLSDTKVDGTGLIHLQGLKKLRKLAITNCKLSAAGSDALGQLTQLEDLSARGSQFSNPELRFTEQIGKLLSLSSLSFGEGSRFTDADLAPLAALKKLETLSMDNTSGISGSGLAHLAGSASTMKYVRLDFGCAVSDEGIKAIVTTLPNLEQLVVGYGGSCGPDGLRSITSLKKLTNFTWTAKAVLTDADFGLFATIPSLEVLGIHNRDVSNGALAELARCKKVTRFNLGNTQGFDDTGLQALKAVKTLREVALSNTQVTDKGIAEFQKARPDVKVTR